MQRELAASGLSDEEILAKTLLLQKVNLSYFEFVKSTVWNPRICIILNTYLIVNALLSNRHNNIWFMIFSLDIDLLLRQWLVTILQLSSIKPWEMLWMLPTFHQKTLPRYDFYLPQGVRGQVTFLLFRRHKFAHERQGLYEQKAKTRS